MFGSGLSTSDTVNLPNGRILGSKYRELSRAWLFPCPSGLIPELSLNIRLSRGEKCLCIRGLSAGMQAQTMAILRYY